MAHTWKKKREKKQNKKKNKTIETIPEQALMLDLLDEDFKTAINFVLN